MILIILTALGFSTILIAACIILILYRENAILQRRNGRILARAAAARQRVGELERRNDYLLRENDVLHAEVAHLYRLNAQLMARNDFFYAENEEAA